MLTREQRCKIAAWQEVFQSPTEVQRRFHATYGPHYEPTRRTIYAIHAKFMETGSVNDQPRSGRPRSGRSEENQEVVETTFVQDQTKSIRRASLELNISRATIHRLLRKDIGMYPYKLQIVQSLEPQDYDSRLEMCETLIHRYEEDPNILEQMWFSDEAVFHTSGKVNRHNTRFWGKENPVQVREHQRDSPKLVVWCAISSAGLIGPHFFKNDDGDTVNVSGDNYLHMLRNFFLPRLAQVADINNVIFQQDGAPPHYSLAVRSFLNEHFADRWIGRRGPLEWAPRSPDLTPCDFFLWGHIKTLVYANNPRDLPTLEARIREVCNHRPEHARQRGTGMPKEMGVLHR